MRQKIHCKLRRAIRQMYVEHDCYNDPVVESEDDKHIKFILKSSVSIRVNPGVKVTKWHRLARIKVIREIRESQIRLIADVINEQIKPD